MTTLTESQAVETIYAAADAMLAAGKALNRIPFGRRAELDTLLDGRIYPGDLDTLAKTLTALADKWQGDIERDEEAEDRRRDNPLQTDFRRLGV